MKEIYQFFSKTEVEKLPKYANCIINQEDNISNTTLSKEQVLLLQTLYQAIKRYEKPILWQCYLLVERKAFHIERDDWCYLCELLIEELNGTLPLFDYVDQLKQRGV